MSIAFLKGEKPADLPVQRPTAFVTCHHLKTDNALGLHISDRLLALSD